MPKRQVFYSFHFDNDVMRVQQIRNMGVIEGNTPVSPNEWETVKQMGDLAVQRWIDENLRYKSALVVLIGAETYKRRWVRYEIQKAWNDGKAVLGIYIHNLNCPRNGQCTKGPSPFDYVSLGTEKLSSYVKCYDPGLNAYNQINQHIDSWIETAIQIRSII